MIVGTSLGVRLFCVGGYTSNIEVKVHTHPYPGGA